MIEHRYGYNNETVENRTPPIQVDLNVDFEVDGNKIVNITYNENMGYKRAGLQCAHTDVTGDYGRVIKPCLDAIDQAIYYKDKKNFYTTPKIKIFGGRTIVLSLPLDKVDL